VLRAIDQLGNAGVVAVLDQLGGEDDIGALVALGHEVAVFDRVGEQPLECGLADEGHRIELREIVEPIIVGGARLAIVTVAVGDDAGGGLRVEAHLVVELLDVDRGIVDQREDSAGLGGVRVDPAVRLPAAERPMLGVARLVTGALTTEQRDQDRHRDESSCHGPCPFKTWADVGQLSTKAIVPGIPVTWGAGAGPERSPSRRDWPATRVATPGRSSRCAW
jgi:hypothetical protein